jgi:hypothetical protein
MSNVCEGYLENQKGKYLCGMYRYVCLQLQHLLHCPLTVQSRELQFLGDASMLLLTVGK